jgi:hypothetical protein
MTLFIPLQVTAVGLNTEWGLLMASISEDNNEETPLQVSPLYLLLVLIRNYDIKLLNFSYEVYFMALFFSSRYG